MIKNMSFVRRIRIIVSY